MTIDARELRIGNYWMPEWSKEIRQADWLDIRDIAEGRLIGKALPIPLTEDWLKRVDWGGYNELHFNSNFCLDSSGHLYYRSDYTGINVYYVHQLQNLYYALTNSELTIKEQV